MTIFQRPLIITLVLILLCASFQPVQAKSLPVSGLLTYEELLALYASEKSTDELQAKLDKLLTTPFVNNEGAPRGSGDNPK